MSDPTIVEAQGVYFDGLSAKPHPVNLRFGDRLEIVGPDVRADWSPFDIRAGDTAAPMRRIKLVDSPVQVEFTDPHLSAAFEARCPDLRRGEETRSGLLRLVLWSIVAGITVLLATIFAIPPAAGVLAPLVPASVETRFGIEVERQVVTLLSDPPLCNEPAAQAVLETVVERLTEGANLPVKPVVSVRRHSIANALTLPGGRVIILSKLIDEAKTADEFAGVLGHELGHVLAHDPTRSVIAAGGISFMLSLILGDVTGSTIIVTVAQAAISAGYSRDAERAADAFGVQQMQHAGGDPAGLASILERIDDEKDPGSSLSSFLRSHPYTKERAETIRGLAGPDTAGKKIITDAEWATLRNICPPKAEKTAPSGSKDQTGKKPAPKR